MFCFILFHWKAGRYDCNKLVWNNNWYIKRGCNPISSLLYKVYILNSRPSKIDFFFVYFNFNTYVYCKHWINNSRGGGESITGGFWFLNLRPRQTLSYKYLIFCYIFYLTWQWFFIIYIYKVGWGSACNQPLIAVPISRVCVSANNDSLHFNNLWIYSPVLKKLIKKSVFR